MKTKIMKLLLLGAIFVSVAGNTYAANWRHHHHHHEREHHRHHHMHHGY